MRGFEVFNLIVHVSLGVVIVGAYLSLGTRLLPYVVARFGGKGNHQDAIRIGGRSFFLGCATFHILVMGLFYASDSGALLHGAIHLTEVAQAVGAIAFIRGSLNAAQEEELDA